MSKGKINQRNAGLYNSIEEVLETARKANGHRFSEFNVNNRSLKKSSKGSMGQIIEEGVFHYPVNSSSKADFTNLGVELKVTGLTTNKDNHYKMKERLVLNLINYDEEAKANFEDSSFWTKNEKLLIMFYLYDYNLLEADYLILNSFLHSFSKKDLEIIKADWEIIHNKILRGEAHNISEADTMYLAACTKGASAESSYKTQPYSKVKAKQRAYCLKASYMNTFIDKSFYNITHEEVFDYYSLKHNSVELIIKNKFMNYFDKAEDELISMFNVNIHAKSKFNLLCAKILGINGNINDAEEFKKANIKVRTIRVEENGLIRESMSFPHFVFEEIVNQEWEESDIYIEFYSTKYLFVIFKKENNVYKLKDVKLWNMSLQDLEEYVKPVFNHTKKTISEGNIVKEIKNGRLCTNFLGSSFNNVCHVRPHDQKGPNNIKKGLKLPVADKLTGRTSYSKFCFWLDRKYIKEIINAS